ncbi:MAG TPA: glucose 1-dehydrogenase [Candidatus Binataceae bacterium]|jgi:NAD(P)-dependent dehydrogenase (short-subunit alcohol dehydrogenase family)|nr:glucose 1-dehydrogenase [Candidatus Binataceae bacterium]
MGKLDGKIALITGSGSGIGRASALLFAAEGAKVSVVDWAEDRARAVAAEIAARGGEAIALRADVSRAADAERMVAETVRRFGRLDVLFNNAGIGFARRTHLLTEEEWDRTIDIDLKGVFLGCKYGLPELMKQGGVILSTASVAGLEGIRQMAAYCAAKAGVIMLTKSLAMDYAEYGVRVNCVCPGTIETPLSDTAYENLSEERRERARRMVAAMHLLGRTGRPEEIASVALFLCSQDASFITGQAVVVDGGYSAGHRMIRLS